MTLGALGTVTGAAINFNTAAGGANASSTTLGNGTIVISGQSAGTAFNSNFTVTDAGGFGLATVDTNGNVIRLTTTTPLPASGAVSGTDYLIVNATIGPRMAVRPW